MGLLDQIGIQKGKPFEPDAEAMKAFATAAPEALEYMIDLGQWDHEDYYDATYENCDH